MCAKLDFAEVTETEFDHDFRKIVVKCDECGNTTETSHFFCGEFLPISMYCVRCRKNTPCHSRYADV